MSKIGKLNSAFSMEVRHDIENSTKGGEDANIAKIAGRVCVVGRRTSPKNAA
jgi:hypothetical protein